MRMKARDKSIKEFFTLPQTLNNDHQHSNGKERRKQDQIEFLSSRSQTCRCPKHPSNQYTHASLLHSHTFPFTGQDIPYCSTIYSGPIFLLLLLLQCLAITQANGFFFTIPQKRPENILETLSKLGETLNKDQRGIGSGIPGTNIDFRTFRLHYLRNSSIKCNDGSRAGYYIRKSKKKCSKNWLVYLQGGWYCFDGKTCKRRKETQYHLFSSRFWRKRMHSGGGILSWEDHVNPIYHNYHVVYVPYCSSDLWTGTTHDSSTGYYFHGSHIIKQVFKDLTRRHLFKSARSVLVAGSSAGGIGVLMNIDRVARMLRRSLRRKIRLRGLVDSAWFLNVKPHVNYTVCNNIFDCDPIVALKEAIKLWKPKFPKTCIKKINKSSKQWVSPIERWNCFLGPFIYSTIKSPIYIVQSLFDDAQLRAARLPILEGGDRMRFTKIRDVGLQVQRSLREVKGVFAHACVDHEVLTKNNWGHLEINGVTLISALRNWDIYLRRRHSRNRGRKTGRRGTRHKIKGCSERKNKHRHRNRSRRFRYNRKRQRHSGRYIRHSHQLIDTCSQPHIPESCNLRISLVPLCNPTCAPISHPVNGRRMSLMDLLQLYSINVSRVMESLRVPYERMKNMNSADQIRLLYCGRQRSSQPPTYSTRSRPHR